MGPSQQTLKQVARAIKYLGLGVRLVGPVGDFSDYLQIPGEKVFGTPKNLLGRC